MKCRHKNYQRCYKNGRNKNTVNALEIINKFKGRRQIGKRHERVRSAASREPGPMQYVFYAILNTDVHMNQGTAAANIASGLISLHNKLDTDQVKCQYIDNWSRNGRRIEILKGYDHKHLMYLQEELKFIAIGTYIVRQSWGRNRAIIVLAVFGQKEDLEEVFEGLSYLR